MFRKRFCTPMVNNSQQHARLVECNANPSDLFVRVWFSDELNLMSNYLIKAWHELRERLNLEVYQSHIYRWLRSQIKVLTQTSIFSWIQLPECSQRLKCRPETKQQIIAFLSMENKWKSILLEKNGITETAVAIIQGMISKIKYIYE